MSHGATIDAGIFEYVINNHRWAFCLILLPISAAFDAWLKLKHVYTFWTRERAPAKHKERVAEVQRQVRVWAESGAKGTMCTARPGWQTMSLRIGKYKATSRNIKIDLFDILEVDTVNKCVRVEPMVTMGQLTAAINPLGWTLPVVPELDDLTIGGLIAGVGVETSSHIYGLFQHICREFEVVLADASVVTCSATQRPDLFYNVPWSHGTLGFVVSATIQMVPCKPYVRLRYVPCHSKAAALALFDAEARKGRGRREAEENGLRNGPQNGGAKGEGDSAWASDFVEALAYSPSKYVVMLGDMVDEAEVQQDKINKIGLYWKEWFFLHVAKFLSLPEGSKPAVEYIPLRHYYHRHTRSLFWEIQEIIPFGNEPWFRWTLGWMMPPKPSMLKLTQTETLRQLYEKHHVVQDMLVPMTDLDESLSVFDREFNIYPLWLCPMRIPRPPGHTGLVAPPKGSDDDLFVDIGGYGNPKTAGFEARASCRRVEDFVRSKHGFQMMYADTYMTREEFREMFDHAEYDRLRAALAHTQQGFPEIYDKVCKSNRI
ncbi:hypothetical protein JKP88DRAFT_271415 [Tribonema minus]|uniref:Delta(24)-sterol reductase n=1 Tax=Tribonema minus TaxID=303371 RepID=A0A835ZG55_9STRA|nr:hypothetical protein JKP88DRAFT_271415 [Tribonema minus]